MTEDQTGSQSDATRANVATDLTYTEVIEWIKKHPLLADKPFELTPVEWQDARLNVLCEGRDAIICENDALLRADPQLDIKTLQYTVEIRLYRREQRWGTDSVPGRYVPCYDMDKATPFGTTVSTGLRPAGSGDGAIYYTAIRPTACDKADHIWSVFQSADLEARLCTALRVVNGEEEPESPLGCEGGTVPIAHLAEMITWWNQQGDSFPGFGRTMEQWSRTSLIDQLRDVRRSLDGSIQVLRRLDSFLD